MKQYQIYFSPTGGTKKVVSLLAQAWKDPWETIDLSSFPFEPGQEISREDLCIIAVPSFGGRVPDIVSKRIKKIRGNGAKAILVAVYGNRAYEDTLLELKDLAEQSGFFCIAAVAAVAEHSIMRQFAAGRPDTEDKKQLIDFSHKVKAHLDTILTDGTLTVPGHFPYKDYHTIPFYPTAGETCVKCGLCAARCPAGAIPKQEPSSVTEKDCISCMRCISVCPLHARALDPQTLQQTAQKMKPLFLKRKANELFLSDFS